MCVSRCAGASVCVKFGSHKNAANEFPQVMCIVLWIWSLVQIILASVGLANKNQVWESELEYNTHGISTFQLIIYLYLVSCDVICSCDVIVCVSLVRTCVKVRGVV